MRTDKELTGLENQLLNQIEILLKSHRQLTFNENHNLFDTPIEAETNELIKYIKEKYNLTNRNQP